MSHSEVCHSCMRSLSGLARASPQHLHISRPSLQPPGIDSKAATCVTAEAMQVHVSTTYNLYTVLRGPDGSVCYAAAASYGFMWNVPQWTVPTSMGLFVPAHVPVQYAGQQQPSQQGQQPVPSQVRMSSEAHYPPPNTVRQEVDHNLPTAPGPLQPRVHPC